MISRHGGLGCNLGFLITAPIYVGIVGAMDRELPLAVQDATKYYVYRRHNFRRNDRTWSVCTYVDRGPH